MRPALAPPLHSPGRRRFLTGAALSLSALALGCSRDSVAASGAPRALPASVENSDTTVLMLRIQFGMRRWFTDLWPEGYESQRIYDRNGRPIEGGRIERVRERR